MKEIGQLGRAETAALVTNTLAEAGIEVVLVGGSCVCIWTKGNRGGVGRNRIHA